MRLRRAGGTLPIGGVSPALHWLYAMRNLQHEAVVRLFEARHRDLPGKVREAAVQVKLHMVVFFNFAARVILVW